MKRVVWASKIDSLDLIQPLIDEMDFLDGYYSASDLRLILSEAVTNVIYHAHTNDSTKQIVLEWGKINEIYWQGLTINDFEESWFFSIQDEGSGYNLNNIPIPFDQPGGRGVLIMKALTKFICYQQDEHRLVFII